MNRVRVVVIGAGSAGTGAAWRAAKCGADVFLLESAPFLGGTSTIGGVHCWEPGIASNGLNRQLYRHMRKSKNAASVGKTIHPYDSASHIGLNGVLLDEPYESTLRRGTLNWQQTARVHFEPTAMAAAMRFILDESGVTTICNMACIGAEINGEHIVAVRTKDLMTGEEYLLHADVFVDCSADAVFCRGLNIKTRFGEDCFDDFLEPSAPRQPTGIVNGVSLCFRVTRGDVGEEAPRWVYDTEASDWIAGKQLPCSNVNLYPNGDRNYNPLPLMQGAEYFALVPSERMRILVARVWLYWEWMKREHGHRGWHIKKIMARPGVRESWRVCALEMTTENDLRLGCFRQGDDIIALGDHTLDTHGERTGQEKLPRELSVPFGVKMGSLIVPVFDNLLVAGRCAGFSHLAASSCRLSRTMMDIGEAAGALAALGGDMREKGPAPVRSALRFDEYLDWAESKYPLIGEC